MVSWAKLGLPVLYVSLRPFKKNMTYSNSLYMIETLDKSHLQPISQTNLGMGLMMQVPLKEF